MSGTASDEHINRIRTALARRTMRLADLDRAQAALREQIRQGLAEGLSASDLAAASGLPLEEIQRLGQFRPAP